MSQDIEIPPEFRRVVKASLKEVEMAPSEYLGGMAIQWDSHLSQRFKRVRTKKTGEPGLSLEIACLASLDLSNEVIEPFIVATWDSIRLESHEVHMFVSTESSVHFYFLAKYLRDTGRCLVTGRVQVTKK